MTATLLKREVTLAESVSSTDIDVLFSYCVQAVENNNVINNTGYDNWEDGDHSVTTYLSPLYYIDNVAALRHPELIVDLKLELDKWLKTKITHQKQTERIK